MQRCSISKQYITKAGLLVVHLFVHYYSTLSNIPGVSCFCTVHRPLHTSIRHYDVTPGNRIVSKHVSWIGNDCLRVQKLQLAASKERMENMREDENGLSLFGLSRVDVVEPLSLLLLAQFVLFIGVGAVIPTLPLYGKAIGLSSAGNGIVISAPAVMLLLLAKPAGTLADRGRKPAMLGGLALIALSDLGTACAQTIVPLVLARLGLGAGRCISESGERAMLADIAERAPNLRGRALAAQQAVTALGIAIGAPLGGFIVELYGPRSAFLCVTGAAILSLTLYLFLPETVSKINNHDDNSESGNTFMNYKSPLSQLQSIFNKNNNKDVTNMENNDTTASSYSWRKLLEDPRWQGLSLCEVGYKVGFAAKLTCIPIIAASILPGGAVGAGSLLSAAGLSGLFGSPVGGWMTDRFGAKSTAISSGIAGGIGLIGIPLAINYNNYIDESPFISIRNIELSSQGAAFSAAVILWSLAVSIQGPALTAIAQQYAPPSAKATAMSLPRAAGDAVYLFAPFMLGIIADLDSLPMASECAVAGLCGIIGIIALISF